MTATEILSELAARGVTVSARGDKLKLKPAEALTPELLATVKRHKADIIASLGDPYAERLNAALMSICRPDYPAGMIPWLSDHQPDLYNLLISGIPDTLHKIWANHGDIDEFDRALATWHEAHLTAVEIFKKEKHR